MSYNRIAEQMTLDVLSAAPFRGDEGLNSSPAMREADYALLSEQETLKRTRKELRRYRDTQRRRKDTANNPTVIEDAQANIDLAERLETETMPYTAELIRSNPAALSTADLDRVDSLLSNRSPALSRLLSQLNVNLDQGLSKTDTDNLLAALLVASEDQLETILNNPSVPVVIKTITRRLMYDSHKGDTATIERLWDRLFGKPAAALAIGTATQQQAAAASQQADNSIIPSTPVSREAFLILRETLMQ